MTRRKAFQQVHTRLRPDQHDWLQSEVQRLGLNQNEIIRRCVDAMMQGQKREDDTPDLDGLLNEMLYDHHRMENSRRGPQPHPQNPQF